MNKKEKANQLIKIEIVYDLIIGIYDGCKSDLRDLDFSFLNLKVIKVNTTDFKELIDGIDLSNFKGNNYVQNIWPAIQDGIGFSPTMYALVPIKPNSGITEDTFRIIEKIMLLMFPSDFKLSAIIYYNLKDKNKTTGKVSEVYEKPSLVKSYSISPWNKKFIGLEFLHGRNLEYNSKDLKAISLFLKEAYTRLKGPSYLDLGINSYLSSFEQNDLLMGYLCLCIAIETLTTARTELTYRISRICAVLNAENKEDGKLIEYNIKQFYEFRSTIVHGGDFDKLRLKDYYFNLQALVSRTFTELISLNIPSRENLNELISQYGYGDKASLSNNYKYQKINVLTIELLKAKVPKF